MTGGVVLLGTEHRSRLEYPVIDTHHGLLVKLRALSQLCLFVKVIQPEHIGAAFCAAGHNLRRADFRKMLGMKEIPEASDDAFLNAMGFLSVMGRRASFVSREVFSFHLLTAMGRTSAGTERTRISDTRISRPWGARGSGDTVPVTMTVDSSFKSSADGCAAPSGDRSRTHWIKPSAFLKMIKLTSPMSRMVWTAPLTATVFPV